MRTGGAQPGGATSRVTTIVARAQSSAKARRSPIQAATRPSPIGTVQPSRSQRAAARTAGSLPRRPSPSAFSHCSSVKAWTGPTATSRPSRPRIAAPSRPA